MTDLLNAFPEYPDCQFCKDTGIQYLPDFPPVFRFCACPAGQRRALAEPQVVELANEARMKIGAAE